MAERTSGVRLAIVCGLPGSGKTTYATRLQDTLHAIRLCPDEWMDALSIDIWDEERRAKIEGLQWKLGQQLLALGLTVIMNGALGEGPSAMHCVSVRMSLALSSSCTIYPCPPTSFSTEFNAAAWKTRPSNRSNCCNG